MVKSSLSSPATNDAHEVERRVLRRLRDVLNRPNGLQFKLDRALRLLTAGLGTDVCSLYVNTKENFFTLVASIGLNSKALYVTKLHISEGLVGETARMQAPLYVSNAPKHPNFLFKPEVKEEALTTFMGVPLLRHEQVIGVLVTQTITPRFFQEWEVELLEMAALLLSDLVDQTKKNLTFPLVSEMAHDRPSTFRGRLFAPGSCAYGRALLYHKAEPVFKPLSKLTPDKELVIFKQALNLIRQSIVGEAEQMPEVSVSEKSGEHEEIIATYAMLLDDPAWQGRVESYIARGFKAAAAVLNVQQDMEYQFQQAHQDGSAWIIEDLKDITQKFFFMLHNNNQVDPSLLQQQDLIVVAKTLGPGEFLTLKSYNIKGIILEGGGPNSHVTLLAKSFHIPLLGWVPRITECLSASDALYLDTDHGLVHVNPGLAMVEKLEAASLLRNGEITGVARSKTHSSREATKESVKKCYAKVKKKGFSTYANVGLLEDIHDLASLAVDGVGLLRSELLFLQENEFPSMSVQEAYYSRFIKGLSGKRCCIRTLDIGSDKVLPYFPTQKEENPALGWRSIRIGLDRTTIFRHQVRAILKAGQAFGPVELLYPLIASADEFFACKKIVEEERSILKIPPEAKVRQGAMLETPSLLFDVPRLQGHIDFISVGTNDLWQFFFACDRNNPNVAFRYGKLDYSFLCFLKQLYDVTQRCGIEITICGDLGNIEQEVSALAAIGFRSFSVIPAVMGVVQSILADLDVKWWQQQMSRYLEFAVTHPSYSFSDFLSNHKVPIPSLKSQI